VSFRQNQALLGSARRYETGHGYVPPSSVEQTLLATHPDTALFHVVSRCSRNSAKSAIPVYVDKKSSSASETGRGGGIGAVQAAADSSVIRAAEV